MAICRLAAAAVAGRRPPQKPVNHPPRLTSCRDGSCSSSSLHSVFWPFSTTASGGSRRSFSSLPSSLSTTNTVRIGHVSHTRGPWPPLAPHLLPHGYLPTDGNHELTASMLQDLQWMLAKDALKQDMLLIGPPGAGAVYRRRLALAYAQLVQREAHVVTITADQTESDLKQRREIVVKNSSNSSNGSNNIEKSLCFVNQAPVEAALHGRILVLDGLEKAERNVLPTLNNLLEHRSMNLDDGRLLVSPERYQQLLLNQQQQQNGDGDSGEGHHGHRDLSLLLPVHADFRVIATAVPVPTWQEDAHCSSLDPPLRSRFQIRRIDYPPASSSSAAAASAASALMSEGEDDNGNDNLLLASSLIGALLAASHENKKILQFPVTSLPYLARNLRTFPAHDLQTTLLRQYPVGGCAAAAAAEDEVTKSSSGLTWNSARQIASQRAFEAAWKEVTGSDNAGKRSTTTAGYSRRNKASRPPVFESPSHYYRVEGIERSHVASVTFTTGSADDGYWADATFHFAPTAAVSRTAATTDTATATSNKASKSGWWWSKQGSGNPCSSSELNGETSMMHQVTVQVPVGSGKLWNNTDSSAIVNRNHISSKSPFVSTVGWEEHVWPAMLQEHAMGRDLLLIAPAGEGKTAMAREFCQRLGYSSSSSSSSSSSLSSSSESSCEAENTSISRSVRLVSMYRDMTSRDLFLRRSTDPVTGATGWEETPLLEAIRAGHVCLLDGVEKLRPHVLASSLLALTNDRDVWLDDGRRIVAHDRIIDTSSQSSKGQEADEAIGNIDLDESKIIRVHPTFRIIALASISNNNNASNQSSGSTAWLSDSLISCFSTIMLPRPSRDCMRDILRSAASINGDVNGNGHDVVDEKAIDQLLELRRVLTSEVGTDCGVAPLSTRNLVRVVRRLSLSSPLSTQLHDLLSSVLVADLLPPTQRAALESVFHQVGIRGGKSKRLTNAVSSQSDDSIVYNSDFLSIGDFTMPRNHAQRPEMVPAPKFFDIKSHVLYIKDLLEDWKSGERAFLLLGGQGVGKNMLVDRLCQVANFEREYIQLHRDSTMGQITLQPTLEDGKIVWNDSPMVRAVSEGLSLVIDEADKAPTEVFVVLKALVEDGELMLGDGRRISRHDEGPGIIKMHPDFTLWVLANRPGFPFHGNAFFEEIGDCFSTRVVANPDLTSEISLLQSYGPNVDPALFRSLAGSFAELRSLSDNGDISYPYSTREAVAVIKHLQGYPDDGIVASLHNVLDWDSFDENTYATLGRVFQRHGIPVEDFSSWQELLMRQQALADAKGKLEIVYSGRGEEGTSRSPPPLSNPKEGKWDDKNEAHVGGNQWAGGTGGSDTAGLGGRGGPYRLDRGHKVHQVSEEDKKKVSSEAARAARNMAKKALQERLDSIEMSKSEWDMYRRFVDPIQQDIASLRAILSQVMETRKSSSERGWMKRQSHGELDDTKLVDSVTGDKYVYKRRGTITPNDPTTKRRRPKRLRFVVDVSGSMYRFNGYDERLIRCLEATNLVMESFSGLEGHEFDYSIVGHSGDSPCIPLVDFGKPPATEKDRMKVLQTMVAHSQFCQSGDHTLEAMEQAMMDVVERSGLGDTTDDFGDDSDDDECIVIAISDANLQRYGIHPRELGKIMQQQKQQGIRSSSTTTNSSSVKAYCIFIASFGKEAQEIQQALPIGRGHVCMQTSDLPRIVRQILTMHI